MSSSLFSGSRVSFRRSACNRVCNCSQCRRRRPCPPPPPKRVCVQNCDPEQPLFVRLEEPVEVDGCLLVDNKPDQKLDINASGSLTVSNVPGQPIEVYAKVYNETDCPLFAEVNAFAEVEGDIVVRTDPTDPLLIDGVIRVENNGSDPFCVALDNKDGKTLKVDIGWNEESEYKIPVFGRFEVCNCCDEALKFESDQFQTSKEFAIGSETLEIGTSITDVIATLAQVLAAQSSP